MWIKRADIAGFGKLSDRTIEFDRGVNCVYGPNEAGKTTLMSFLLSMLYGQAKAASARRYLDEDMHDRYAPWKAGTYGGKVTLALDGREIVMARDFSGAADAAQIMDARTGESVAAAYPRNGCREYTLLDKEARVDKKTYEGVFIVRHGSVGSLDAADDKSVADRLVALASSGDEKGGCAAATKTLASAIDAVGSDRAPTKPYYRTKQLREEARALLARVTEARKAYEHALLDKSELAGKVGIAQEEVSQARTTLLLSMEAALGELKSESAALFAEDARLKSSAKVPGDITIEALARAESAVSAAQKALDAARAAETAAAAKAMEAKRGYDGLGVLTMLSDVRLRDAEGAIAELCQARQSALQSQSRLAASRQKSDALVGRWGERWPLFERISAEDVAFLSGATAERARLVEAENGFAQEVFREKQTGGKDKVVAAVAGALGAAMLVAGLLITFFVTAFGVLLIAGAAGSAVVVAMRLKSVSQSRRRMAGADAEIEKLRAATADIGGRVNAICTAYGAKSAQDLLDSVRDFRRDQALLAEMSGDVSACEAEFARLQREAELAASRAAATFRDAGLSVAGSLEEAVKNSLSPDGTVAAAAGAAPLDWRRLFADASSPQKVKETFKPVWDAWDKAAKARRAFEAAGAAQQSAATSARAASGEFDNASSGLSALLKRVGACDAAGLRAMLAERARLTEVQRHIREVESRASACLGGMKMEAFEKELSAARSGDLFEAAAGKIIDEDDIPAARHALEEKVRVLESLKVRLATATATVDEGLKNVPEVAAVEERIAELERRHALQGLHRRALETAFRVITESAGAFNEQVYPQIESRLTALLSGITAGAHEKTSVWSEDDGGEKRLRISVADAGKGAPVAPGALSQGTLEQVYLCARLALAEVLSTGERLPIMLDDPFINYDTPRLDAAFDAIRQVALNHQVLIFTCQDDVGQLAHRRGARVITL